MIQYHEALELILSNAARLQREKVSLHEANLRILAEDVYYDQNLPPFDKSAMDGYACRMEDLHKELRILETIQAGYPPKHAIGPGQCARIMTGAVVPEGADCVFIVEDAELLSNDRVICKTDTTARNICYKAEDVKEGELALASRTLITSKTIPLLAGSGIHRVPVYRQPGITIFSTGTELVEPDQIPLPHQIRNTNSFQMISQLMNIGIQATYGGILQDNRNETLEAIGAAIQDSDIVILSGGVSMGEYDFIPEVLSELKFEALLTKIAVQPGKPILFARKEKKYCFGLAGNPVSSFIQMELFVKPFVFELMGHRLELPKFPAILMDNFHRKNSERLKFIPAFVNIRNEVKLLEYHGSAHIAALQSANCLAEIPLGLNNISKGEEIHVRPL